MKRIIVFMLTLLTMAISVFAAEAPIFILTNSDTVSRFSSGTNGAVVDVHANKFVFSPSNSDPTVTITLKPEEQFSADDNHFVALKMSVKSTITVGGFFFGTSKFPGPQGDEYSQFNIVNDGTMTDYIIDMSSYEHGRWTGTVNKFRIDAINSTVADTAAVITIDRIGFFPTKEAAEEFMKKEFTVEDTTTEDVSTPTATPVTWDFTNDEEESLAWTTSGGSSSRELGLFKVQSASKDCYIMKNLTEDEYFKAEELKYFAYRYLAKDVVGTAGIFFTSDVLTSLSDKSFTPFGISGDGEWHNVVMDVPSVNQNWKGTINRVRVDVSNPSKEHSVVYVSRMGFFSTRQEAINFLEEASDNFDYSQKSTLEAPMLRANIPGNTLSAGYDEKDYLISNTNFKAEAPVVSYTDKNGNSNIVALCDTSSLGFTNYVAAKPGSYKLTTNHKEYADIAGHWATDYINFASDRNLFGGTSPNEFSPELSMTRGMFITVLGRMHGLDTSAYGGDTGYSDVNSAEYYAPYINWAKATGVMAPVTESEFAPEQPVLRKDMAHAISNYMKMQSFASDNASSDNIFTDLSECSADEISAISSVQSLGIINGIGDGLFSPMGHSTRAEVATVMCRTIKTILGTNYATPFTSDYFKRDRIRVGTWANVASEHLSEEYIKMYYEGGFDWYLAFGSLGSGKNASELLKYADKYGVEVFLQNGAVSAENPLEIMAEHYDHPSFTGVYLSDEPGTDSYDKLAEYSKKFIDVTNGEKLPYVNLLPMYANAAQLKYGANAAAIEYYDSDPDLYRKYCQSFVDKFPVDYISTDIYPMRSTIYSEYVESINIIATVARENNKTFWCYFHGSNPDMPTKEFSWQIYSLLSFGCEGFLYWIWSPWAFDEEGNTTNNFEACKPVLLELRAISDIFVSYKNLGAFNHNYNAATTPYLKMTGQYENFDVIEEIVSDDPLLFGCFEKEDGSGKKAFTVVNMYNPRSVKGAEVKLKINAPSITSYYGGVANVLTPENGYYTIKLNVGEGAFITID